MNLEMQLSCVIIGLIKLVSGLTVIGVGIRKDRNWVAKMGEFMGKSKSFPSFIILELDGG